MRSRAESWVVSLRMLQASHWIQLLVEPAGEMVRRVAQADGKHALSCPNCVLYLACREGCSPKGCEGQDRDPGEEREQHVLVPWGRRSGTWPTARRSRPVPLQSVKTVRQRSDHL